MLRKRSQSKSEFEEIFIEVFYEAKEAGFDTDIETVKLIWKAYNFLTRILFNSLLFPIIRYPGLLTMRVGDRKAKKVLRLIDEGKKYEDYSDEKILKLYLNLQNTYIIEKYRRNKLKTSKFNILNSYNKNDKNYVRPIDFKQFHQRTGVRLPEQLIRERKIDLNGNEDQLLFCPTPNFSFDGKKVILDREQRLQARIHQRHDKLFSSRFVGWTECPDWRRD
jgi:hypothetical protein